VEAFNTLYFDIRVTRSWHVKLLLSTVYISMLRHGDVLDKQTFKVQGLMCGGWPHVKLCYVMWLIKSLTQRVTSKLNFAYTL